MSPGGVLYYDRTSTVGARLGTGTVGLTFDMVPIPVRRKQPLEYPTQDSAPGSCSEGCSRGSVTDSMLLRGPAFQKLSAAWPHLHSPPGEEGTTSLSYKRSMKKGRLRGKGLDTCTPAWFGFRDRSMASQGSFLSPLASCTAEHQLWQWCTRAGSDLSPRKTAHNGSCLSSIVATQVKGQMVLLGITN